MELIVAVSSRPIIYDRSNFFYRDRKEKNRAWKSISEELGISEAKCRKRWKSLRDTYLKASKKERERHGSGVAADTTPKWKYMACLSFLKPFVCPRETSSSLQERFEEEQAPVCSPPGEPEPEDQSAAEASAVETADLKEFTLPETPTSPAPSSSTTISELLGSSSEPQKKRARRGQATSEHTGFEKYLLDILTARNQSTTPVCEDQHFLLSLLPLLKHVPAQSKERVKFKVYKTLYEESTFHLENHSGTTLTKPF